MNMLNLDEIDPEKLRPLKRLEYDKLVELGAFEDERVELLHGIIVSMSPQGTRHAAAVMRLNMALTPALVGRAFMRVQSPFGASEDSEPEPDLAVSPAGNYLEDHPSQALLVVEVAETSLRKDRRVKAPLYAECGIPEYWIVNIVSQVVEVFTEPGTREYRKTEIYGRGDAITLKMFPDISVSVEEILG